VIRTRVGYTGGTTRNPTYYRLGDHTETLQLDFDPSRITYQKLLEIFWATPNHCARSGSRQYLSAIFCGTDAQKKLALESRDHLARQGKKVSAEILPLGPFYLAEDYHQKYQLRLMPALLQELQAIYPKSEEFLASTAVARANGYLGGHGSVAQLREEIGRLGLSANGQQELLKAWKSSRREQ
jgi:methionine-S-sulfoxide reductase